MKERSFIDTNILVYTDDAEATFKADISSELLVQAVQSGLGVISTQILQEYFVASTRKRGVQVDIAKQRVQFFSRLQWVSISANDVLSAIDLHRLHGLSFWDALVVQSARNARCTVLLSEDMQHGRIFDGVRVHNPFLS